MLLAIRGYQVAIMSDFNYYIAKSVHAGKSSTNLDIGSPRCPPEPPILFVRRPLPPGV